MDKKEVYLSASRIKTLETCSWSYYCKYHLNIPEKSNSGAKRGTICHLVFELLLNPRHKGLYEEIIASGDPLSCLPVGRLVIKHATREGINNLEDIALINKMILVGLKSDFFPKGGDIQNPEFEFKIERDGYKARGFIDLPILYKEEKKSKIRDYKSSKAKFKGEELTANVQAMLYSIASKIYWPEYEPEVEFIFLRFPKGPVQPVKFTEDELSGFEVYLKHVYQKVSNFSEQDAKQNFAADDVKSRWLCQAGATWVCPFKNEMWFYSIYDKDDKFVKSFFTAEEAKAAKKDDSQVIKKFKYEGCPRWK